MTRGHATGPNQLVEGTAARPCVLLAICSLAPCGCSSPRTHQPAIRIHKRRFVFLIKKCIIQQTPYFRFQFNSFAAIVFIVYQHRYFGSYTVFHNFHKIQVSARPVIYSFTHLRIKGRETQVWFTLDSFPRRNTG